MNNKNYFELLNIAIPEDHDHYQFSTEMEGTLKIIHIKTKPLPTYCPKCGKIMHSKGLYERTVSHPVLQDGSQITLKVHQRRWRCTGSYCTYSMNEDFPFLQAGKQKTTMTPFMILNAMKDLNSSTAAIAQRFNVSDTYVHDIFTAYVDLKRLPLPECLSIDEVYLHLDEQRKYQLVLMDFQTNQIVDILENRYQTTMDEYFYNIPIEERMNVKYLITDAYGPYFSACNKYFPNAVTVLDSFHAVQFLTNSLNNYVNRVLKKYKELNQKKLEQKNHDYNLSNASINDSQEVVLLKKYRWVLLQNGNNRNEPWRTYYHKSLKMRLSTHQIEKMFFNLDKQFKPMFDLKEKYIQFNEEGASLSQKEVIEKLDALIKEYSECKISLFEEFACFLKKHKNSIIESFNERVVTRTQRKKQIELISRLSNGPMESFNRKPKDLKRLTRGMKNFEYNRNRILWATRENAPIRIIPKTTEQIHSHRLNKATAHRRPKKYNK